MDTRPTAQEVLDLTFDHEYLGRISIRGYLKKLLTTLWYEQDGFSGKRPLGDSGWDWELYKPLIEAGYIAGILDGDGYIEDCDESAGWDLIQEAIDAL